MSSLQLAYHSKFKKQYKKLQPAQKERLKKSLRLFQEDPYHPHLYNHPLTGQWTGYRSISFGGDWRAHYMLTDDNVAFFVTLGTHAQLYK